MLDEAVYRLEDVTELRENIEAAEWRELLWREFVDEDEADVPAEPATSLLFTIYTSTKKKQYIGWQWVSLAGPLMASQESK